MKKFLHFGKRFVAVVLIVTLLCGIFAIPASAANNTTDYNAYTAPSSSDYAYWNGSYVVKASGTTTSEIKWMHAALNYCISNKGLSATKLDVDGSFGPASEKACLAFQKKYGLEQDGSFGPSTIAKMKSLLYGNASEVTVETVSTSYLGYSAPSNSDYAYWNGSKVVKASGTTTSEIKWMQAALNYCITYKGVSASLLTVDGSFGPSSKKACLAFQKKYGLEQDGSFGPTTIKKMKAVLDDGSTVVTNGLKDSLFVNAASYKESLGFCFTVAYEVFGSKQFLRTLGMTTASAAAGFTTALDVLTDNELIIGIAELEIARIIVNKAQTAADKVLSFKGKQLDGKTSIQLLEAYRDCAAYTLAANELLGPILDQYAQVADKPLSTKVDYLCCCFLNGAFDGALDVALGGLEGIDKTAKVLLKLYGSCGDASSFAESAFQQLPAYQTYVDTYNRHQEKINQIKTIG